MRLYGGGGIDLNFGRDFRLCTSARFEDLGRSSVSTRSIGRMSSTSSGSNSRSKLCCLFGDNDGELLLDRPQGNDGQPAESEKA